MRRFCPVLLILLSLSYWLALAVGQDRDNANPDAAETLWMPDANLMNSISDVKPLANLTDLMQLSLGRNPISDTSPLYPLLVANGGKIIDIDIDVSE